MRVKRIRGRASGSVSRWNGNLALSHRSRCRLRDAGSWWWIITPGSRQLLAGLLTSWQGLAEAAANASEAVDRLRSTAPAPFDAILIDFEMPEVNGEQVGALIRRELGLASPAMILLTPLSHSADADYYAGRGFAGHLSKPVKAGELGSLLAEILGYQQAALPSAPPLKPSRTGPETRARLHLLIVEDNEVNREVALGILANLGYQADAVEDGRRALAALGERDYDLVLMDCQLPLMDGYETSRRIREPETPVRNHSIPIIATTAHALAGDREKCLEAGMNGYVPKPLRPEALEQAIEEWTAVLPPRLETGTPPALLAAPTGQPATFDRDDLLERLMGNQPLAQRIIGRFVADMPQQLILLAEAVRDSDAQKVRVLAHSIKGAAANVGGSELREIAGKLERSGTAGNLAVAAEILPELSAGFERVKPAMENFCADQASPK